MRTHIVASFSLSPNKQNKSSPHETHNALHKSSYHMCVCACVRVFSFLSKNLPLHPQKKINTLADKKKNAINSKQTIKHETDAETNQKRNQRQHPKQHTKIFFCCI